MANQDNQNQQLASQVPYLPRSRGPSLDTLTPRNMASAVQTALDNLEGRVGDIDAFVARKLNYPSVDMMHEVLAAEQVDGVALAINNIEHGNGALIGDQTGVGKGRQMAAMIRYAKETGRIPVFVTRDAGLYSDIIRDLSDIGVKNFRPFITNSNEKIPLPDGRELKTSRESHAAELDRLIRQGGFSSEDGYDGVFTTYSQMQTVRGKNTPRREFLEIIAPQSLIVMDEAHQAGGSQGQSWSVGGPPNRAEFARGLVDKADGVTFSSATAVKRPDVMDLYGRCSGMREALGSVSELQEALENGGVPLQQVATSMLAQDGFYSRRERSFEGVDFSVDLVAVDRDSTNRMSQIMGQILRFDAEKQDALKELDKQAKASAKKIGGDNAIGRAGAESTNFTAIMHNVMDQAAFARKADQMAEAAIAALQRGEKPILTAANTMGSFIENYAQDSGLKPGDVFDADFSDVLLRYLERSRDVTEADYSGIKTRRPLGDGELGPDAVAAFDKARAMIENANLDFPVSPIDHIKRRVEDAGYSFGEITGRTARLEYDSSAGATYLRRSSHETSKAGKVKATDRFNSGKMDVMLLNRSGATGISLHASEKFEDQRQRHMIVGQAERDVNNHMQMLGRANRTGQVVPPRITLMVGDTPDEKRPAALLEKKMASLNANTTADRRSAGYETDEVPDFFNKYGDAVVEQILGEYPEINAKLDFPITVSEEVASLDDATEGALAKVTGRLPLLSVEEQEAFYNLLEEEYSSFVKQQKALGNNLLEAEAVDLDARSLAQAEVIPQKPNVRSVFGSGVQAEVMDVKAQSKPKTQLEVINEVRGTIGLELVDSLEAHDAAEVDQVSQEFVDDLLEKANRAAEQYLQQQRGKLKSIQDPEKRQSALGREERRVNQQRDKLTQLKRFRPGQTVRLETEKGRVFYGAISGVSKSGQSLDSILTGSGEDKGSFGGSNPVAASKWQLRVSLADSSREVPVPLSKVNTDRMGAVEMRPAEKTIMGKAIMGQFDERQSGEREVRQVLRGNLLRAAQQYGRKGDIINATTSKGGVEPMLLLPKGYDLQKELSETPIVLPAARNIHQFMELTGREGIVKTSDEQITLKASKALGEYILQTGRRQKDVYLDGDLLEVAGDEFYSVSDRMELAFPEDRLEEVVSYIQNGRSQKLEAVTHLEQARELTGQSIPEFSWSDSVEEVIEKAGLPPSIDMSGLDQVRDRLEATFSEPDELDGLGELDEQLGEQLGEQGELDEPGELDADGLKPDEVLEPEAYRLDPEGPTTIGQERVRLLQEFPSLLQNLNADNTEAANAIAGRDDQLEALEDDLGEEARISFTDPDEQEMAIAAEEARCAGDRPSEYPAKSRIGSWTQQQGKAEKHVGKLIEDAGLGEALMANEEFYLKVENEPFQPLNIERHGEQLHLYHTATEGGDTYIETEMTFDLSRDGRLSLSATAVQNPMFSSVGRDRSFAGMFAKNLRDQGFDEAAKAAAQLDAEFEKPEAAEPEPFHVEDAADKVEQVQGRIEVGEEFTFVVDSGFDSSSDDLYTMLEAADDGSQSFLLYNSEGIRAGEDGASVEAEIGYDASDPDLSDIWVRVPDFDAQLEAHQAVVDSPEGESAPSAAPARGPRAIAKEEVDQVQQEPASEAEPVQDGPFDYRKTLRSLRASADELPSAQRKTLLEAVQQVEAMQAAQQQPLEQSVESELPGQTPAPVLAGDLVTSAIAQNAPYLDTQLTTTESGDSALISPVEQFRNWYRAARALGKDNQLGRIQTLGELAKEERLTSISDKDADQMAADLAEFKEQRKQKGLGQEMIGDARRFMNNLNRLGLVERDEDGVGRVDGNIYSVQEDPNSGEISVVNRETGGAFAANRDGIVTASGLTEEDQRRWQKLGSSSPQSINSQLERRLQQRQSRQQVEL